MCRSCSELRWSGQIQFAATWSEPRVPAIPEMTTPTIQEDHRPTLGPIPDQDRADQRMTRRMPGPVARSAGTMSMKAGTGTASSSS